MFPPFGPHGHGHGHGPFPPQMHMGPPPPFGFHRGAPVPVFNQHGVLVQYGAPNPVLYQPIPLALGTPGRRKKALLVGCSYAGTESKLNGCLNDINCMQYLLKSKFGFEDSAMVLLRDDTQNPDFTPTKFNIFRAITWLMMDVAAGDHLVFHFSGHGTQRVDNSGDEEDGKDEAICPTDFQTAGTIVDDDLNKLMVRPLPAGASLTAIVDACHSGSALDLSCEARIQPDGQMFWKGQPSQTKGTQGGFAVQFGACRDDQVAQDTKGLSGTAYTGAATFCFIDAIERYGVQQSMGEILKRMTEALVRSQSKPQDQSGGFGFLASGAASKVQAPVLSCDRPFDLTTTHLQM